MLRVGANGLPILRAIDTPRLRLEPLVEAHASALFAGLRSDTSYECIGRRPPESVEALAQHIRRLVTRVSSGDRESWLNWALWSAPAGRYVGVVQATLHSGRSARLTFVLFHEAWGDGCAREAATALIDHLHAEWGLSDVWAAVDVRNRRSIALLEGLGFLRIAARTNAEVIRGVTDEFVYCLSLAWPSFTFIT